MRYYIEKEILRKKILYSTSLTLLVSPYESLLQIVASFESTPKPYSMSHTPITPGSRVVVVVSGVVVAFLLLLVDVNEDFFDDEKGNDDLAVV